MVKWRSIAKYSSIWNTLATLLVMANGLTTTGFISWFAQTMSTHLNGHSPMVATAILVLVFYFSHYLFASFTAHTATLMPVILAVAKGIEGINLSVLSMLLVLSIGIMGVLTPYATGPDVIIYGTGYMKSKDYWRLGAILGVIFIGALLLIGCPVIALWLK